MRYLFTSESVTEGHPDKICDQISDAILDEALLQDPDSRVACETVVSTGLVLITGEITSRAKINYSEVARETIKNIGYINPNLGFSADTCSIVTAINNQSPDISAGVTSSLETRSGNTENIEDSMGAGDQGIMFGFACQETPELMPLPIASAHKLARKLAQVRKLGELSYLGPDGKTQVTVEYKNNIPNRIDTVLISTQHAENISLQQIKQDLIKYIIEPSFADYSLAPDKNTNIIINPSGRFVVGGPCGDAGLTGRKIIVDTYGGYARHGGGAFSGKDPSKVDRSAAYIARYAAKNIVASGLAKTCEIQLSYAIGMAKPVSVSAFSHGTAKISDQELSEIVANNFDFRPWSIIQNFKLKNLPRENNGRFYSKIASYGHFGRSDIKLPWENLDKTSILKKYIKNNISENQACFSSCSL